MCAVMVRLIVEVVKRKVPNYVRGDPLTVSDGAIT